MSVLFSPVVAAWLGEFAAGTIATLMTYLAISRVNRVLARRKQTAASTPSIGATPAH